MGLILEARSPILYTVCARVITSQSSPSLVRTEHAVVMASCLVERARSNYVHMMIYQS